MEADRAKTKSSLRTLPLVASFAQRLRALKEQQAYNEKLCGNCYNQKYKGYLFVDEMGNLILPNAVTDGFAKLLGRPQPAEDPLPRSAPPVCQAHDKKI